MLFDTETVPTRKELLIDLAAFGGTAVFAVVQDWKAADIVWASWITSLLIGLSFFLILTFKKLRDYTLDVSSVRKVEGDEASERSTGVEDEAEEKTEVEDEEKEGNKPAPMNTNPGCLGLAVGGLMALLAWLVGPGPVRMSLCFLVGLDLFALLISILAPRDWLGASLNRPAVRAFFYLPTALFLFFFFLMHFGGFHMGHAVFLSFFVPPEVEFTVPAAADSVADTLELRADTSELPVDTAETQIAVPEEEVSFGEAWADLREALVDSRGAFFAFLGLLTLTYWPYILSVAVREYGVYRDALRAKSKQGDEMLLPYKNVIRVHLLIFVLVPFAAFGSGLALTICVLFFFFFPVESVVAWVKSGN